MDMCERCGRFEATDNMEWGKIYYICAYCYAIWAQFFRNKYGDSVNDLRKHETISDFKKFVEQKETAFVFR